MGGRMVAVRDGVWVGGGGADVRVAVGVELLWGVAVAEPVRSGVAVCVPGVRVPEVVGGGVGVPIGGIVGVSGGVRSGVGGGVSVGGKLMVGDAVRVRVRVGVVVVVGVWVAVGVCEDVREGEGEQEGTSASVPGPLKQGAFGCGSSARASRASGRLTRTRKIDRAMATRASPTAAPGRDGSPSPMPLFPLLG
jgi:hypothetical protein